MITKRIASSVFLPLVAACVMALLFMAIPAHAQNVQVDLSSTSGNCGGQQCFNVAGLFTTGTQFVGTSGMDNGHNGCTPPAPYQNSCPDAYSSTQLGLSSATPPALTPPSLNVPFIFGPVNTASCGPTTSLTCTVDVVNFTPAPGVEVTLPAAQQAVYSTLIILGTAVNGSHAGQITVTYTDNTTNVLPQALSDWCGFSSNPNESIAVGGINRINSDGTLNGASCNLYAYTYALDVTRSLQSITLTDTDGSGSSYALAMSLKPPTYTIAGGVANPATVAPGAQTTAAVTVNPQPGYVGTINLSCGISPTIIGDPPSAATAPTCSLSPTSVTVTAGESAAPTTMMTFTAAPPATAAARHSTPLFYALLLPFMGLAWLGLSVAPGGVRRRPWLSFWLGGMLLALLLVTPACVSTVHLGNVGTPPGQYTIAITGQDTNGLTQSSNPTGTTNTVIVTVTGN